MEDKPKKPSSAEVLSQAPRRDTCGPEHAVVIRNCGRVNCRRFGMESQIQQRAEGTKIRDSSRYKNKEDQIEVSATAPNS